MKKILLLVLLASCSPSTSKLDLSRRHLGEEYAKKYLLEKFKVLDTTTTCDRWEDLGYGKTQSVICSIGDQVGMYCRAGDGKAPSCEFLVDKRPKPPEPTTEPKK